MVAFAIPAAAGDLSLVADVSDRTLEVHIDGEFVKSFGVAVGKEAHPTPTGSFTIEKLIWNPSWVPPPDAEWAEGKERTAPGDPDNPMKVVKIFFEEPDYYIHGTGDTDSIGDAASHGCLRMTPAEVEELARLVMEHGGEPRSESWYSDVTSSDETKVIRLDRPVPLSVRP